MTKRTTKDRWSYSAGERGRNRVRVYERKNGMLYVEHFARGKKHRESLGHRDRDMAKREADETAAKLAANQLLAPPDLTLGQLFDIYEREALPAKTTDVRKFRRAASKRLKGVIGTDYPVKNLSRREWDLYQRERESGRVTGTPVGPRTIARDLKFYRTVLNWATRAGNGHGGTLLERNPWAGLSLPSEKNPNRPMVTPTEYESMLGIAANVAPAFQTMLIVGYETGRRGHSIRLMRWEDIDWEAESIHWRAENDKAGYESNEAVSREALTALREHRSQNPGIGTAFVFPSPRDAAKPLSRHLLRAYWRRAERQAGLERVKGRGFHSLRRRFATDMDDQPLHVVADLGGWKDHGMVLMYQQSSDAQRREALTNRKRA